MFLKAHRVEEIDHPRIDHPRIKEIETEMVAEKEVVAQSARKVLRNAVVEILPRRTAEMKDLSTFPISPR